MSASWSSSFPMGGPLQFPTAQVKGVGGELVRQFQLCRHGFGAVSSVSLTSLPCRVQKVFPDTIIGKEGLGALGKHGQP